MNLLTLALAVGIAFTATASFRRELESGVLELLLISPLTPSQIVYGRIWGLFCHFLPAIAVLGLHWLLAAGFDFNDHNYYFYRFNALPALIIAPPVGIAASFLRINFIFTWLIACLVTLILAAIYSALFGSVLIGALALTWFCTRTLNNVARKLSARTFELAGA